MKYQRMVEIYVKPDLRDKIKSLKGGKTSDEFLRELLKDEKKESPTTNRQARGKTP